MRRATASARGLTRFAERDPAESHAETAEQARRDSPAAGSAPVHWQFMSSQPHRSTTNSSKFMIALTTVGHRREVRARAASRSAGRRRPTASSARGVLRVATRSSALLLGEQLARGCAPRSRPAARPMSARKPRACRRAGSFGNCVSSALGQHARGLDELRIVQQHERLQRRRRGRAGRCRLRARRRRR